MPAPMSKPDPVLSVRDLKTQFRTDDGIVTAIEDVSFDLLPGETLGIVGESGCGKSVTSKSIMRLLPAHSSRLGDGSRVMFDGIDLAHASDRTMRTIRGDRIAMIFQEPMTALNPVFTIGWQLDEALKYHTNLNRKERRARSIEMLKTVEIPNPESRIDSYPHQLSGGMRQRVVIALALSCEPDVLIADEPTTALDVTIQAQILRLMNELKERTGTAILLITHDLGVIAQVCDRVVVMYAGHIVEIASVDELFHEPQHPYTKALLESIPHGNDAEHGKRLATIDGIVPGLTDLPAGCRFYDRCPIGQPRCTEAPPPLYETGERRYHRCYFPLTEPAPAHGNS